MESMSTTLKRIFAHAYDVLSPSDFVGARYSRSNSGNSTDVYFDIVSVQENTYAPDGSVMATVQSVSAGSKIDRPFPGHEHFAEVIWDDPDLQLRIDAADKECDERELRLKQKAIKQRDAREKRQAVASLRTLIDGYPVADETPVNWSKIIQVLDIVFDELVEHEAGSCGFVSQQIEREAAYGTRIILSSKQQKWLHDLCLRVIERNSDSVQNVQSHDCPPSNCLSQAL